MKTAQEARKGDRVWVKRYPTRHLEEVVIDNPEHWTESDDFNEDWGYLADNETVIGGVLVKPSGADAGWLIDIYSIPLDSILSDGNAFTKCCDYFKMNDGDMQAIQDHVRKHSAASKPKRTAKDAQIGDKVWLAGYGGLIETEITHVYATSVEIGDAECFDLSAFGTDWGFWEDRPQAHEAKPEQPKAEPKAQPAPEQPSPQFGNVKLLIKTKGLDWVKANLPDAWRAYKDAGLEKARQEGDKLAKPGILAGKFASPY